jgi:hypothetical protein
MSSAYPTSLPTSLPTSSPTYGPSDSRIVAIIFVSNLLGIFFILFAYFIGGNIFYLDELKNKMINAHKQNFTKLESESDTEISLSKRIRLPLSDTLI